MTIDKQQDGNYTITDGNVFEVRRVDAERRIR